MTARIWFRFANSATNLIRILARKEEIEEAVSILDDLITCKDKYQVWNLLARREVLFMFKRTKLGISWLILENLLQVIFLSIFASLLFDRDWVHYILQVTLGLLGFELISKFISQGTKVYSDSPYFTSTKFPPLIWNFKFIWKLSLIFRFELFAASFIVLILNLKSIDFELIFLPFFILCILFNGFTSSVILGIVGARFRDFAYLAGASIRLLFFITPVFWSLDELPLGSPLVVLNEINPIAISISFIRYCFSLSEFPNPSSIYIYIAYSGLTLTLAVALYRKYARSLRAWV